MIDTLLDIKDNSDNEYKKEKTPESRVVEKSQELAGPSVQSLQKNEITSKVDDYLERLLDKKSSYKTVYSDLSDKFEKSKRKLRSYDKIYNSNDSMNLSKDDFESRLQSIEDQIQSLNIKGIIHDSFCEVKPVTPGLPYKRSEPKKPSLLPVLSEDQWNETLSKIKNFGSNDSVVNNFRVTVTRSELSTLMNNNWLCDSVINIYMQMLHNRSLIKDLKLSSVMVMNTFFFTKFCSDGYRPVMKWTKDKIIFKFDLFIFPVHVKNIHWCLICVDFRDKNIKYFDSMGGCNDYALEKAKEYLIAEHLAKLKAPLENIEKFQLINMKSDIPQQENGYDCGVFACTIAEHLTREAELKFAQENIPSIRKRMIYEILNQTLLTTETNFNNKE